MTEDAAVSSAAQHQSTYIPPATFGPLTTDSFFKGERRVRFELSLLTSDGTPFVLRPSIARGAYDAASFDDRRRLFVGELSRMADRLIREEDRNAFMDKVGEWALEERFGSPPEGFWAVPATAVLDPTLTPLDSTGQTDAFWSDRHQPDPA